MDQILLTVRTSCPDCGGRRTCPVRDSVLREMQRTGYPVGDGVVFLPFGEAGGLSGPGRTTQ